MRDRVRIRRATRGDAPSIEELIPLSVRHLARGFYTPLQIESALRFAFGLDSQLIDDGTYLVAESGERLVGCGGWSKRRKIYGGD